MALQMNEEQRLQALADYNPVEHLTTIKDKSGNLKPYYGASWRLYELTLRYPNANFSSDVIFFDVEKNTCLVRARLFLGSDYEMSDKKAEAHKTGPFTSLDKVETAAKARAARDFGISCEYALDMEDETPAAAVLATIKATVKKLKIVHNPEQWVTFKKSVLGEDVPDEKLTESHLSRLHGKVEQIRKAA